MPAMQSIKGGPAGSVEHRDLNPCEDDTPSRPGGKAALNRVRPRLGERSAPGNLSHDAWPCEGPLTSTSVIIRSASRMCQEPTFRDSGLNFAEGR